MPRNDPFNSIGYKITLVLGIFLTVSFASIAYYYTDYQRRLILDQNEHTMRRMSESILQSLQTIMVAGYADIAQDFADNLKKVPEIVDLRILRRSGNEAFRDNKTIREVNRVKGQEEFLLRETEETISVLTADDPTLLSAIESGDMVSVYQNAGTDAHVLTYIAPILNREACHKCHGETNDIRGVLKLTVSMAPVMADIDRVLYRSLISTVLVIAFILLMTRWLIRLLVVKPAAELTAAMKAAAGGNLDQKIIVSGDDELSEIARSFNTMAEELGLAYESLREEVNERKVAESNLQESEQQVKAIVENVFNAIITIDQHALIVTFNPAAEQIFGYTVEEIIGQNVRVIVDAVNRPSHDSYISEYLAGARAPKVIGFTRDVTGVHKLGYSIPLELTVTEFNKENQRYFIATINDITARKTAEIKLEETQRQMAQQEKMAAIGSLSAGLVHEVGNPIAAISGLIEKIRTDIDDSGAVIPTINGDIDLMMEQINRLMQVIRDVSDFSSPNTTGMDLLDLDGLIDKTCRLIRYDKRMRPINLVLDLKGGLPAVHGNENSLIQVLLNLIQNARDSFDGVDQKDPRITLHSSYDGEKVHLDITDNGCGMDHDTLIQVFDTFFTTKPVSKGTGLGLSVCYTIVREHRGTIAMESEPGQGTTCRITLPVGQLQKTV